LTDSRLQALFNKFDLDGQGHISKQALNRAFSKFGKALSPAQLDCAFAFPSNPESLSITDFKHLLLGANDINQPEINKQPSFSEVEDTHENINADKNPKE